MNIKERTEELKFEKAQRKNQLKKKMQLSCQITAQRGRRVPLPLLGKNENNREDDVAHITSTVLRKMVAEVTHIPVHELRMIFRGRMITDSEAGASAIEEYKLEPNSVVHCMGQPVENARDTESTTTTTTAAAAARQHPIGTIIRKNFKGKLHTGTVTRYDDEHKLYWIDYEDGDSEELSHKKVDQFTTGAVVAGSESWIGGSLTTTRRQMRMLPEELAQRIEFGALCSFIWERNKALHKDLVHKELLETKGGMFLTVVDLKGWDHTDYIAATRVPGLEPSAIMLAARNRRRRLGLLPFHPDYGVRDEDEFDVEMNDDAEEERGRRMLAILGNDRSWFRSTAEVSKIPYKKEVWAVIDCAQQPAINGQRVKVLRATKDAQKYICLVKNHQNGVSSKFKVTPNQFILETGTRVKVQGLASSTYLNGIIGIIRSFDKEKRLYAVSVSVETMKTFVVPIKPINLNVYFVDFDLLE